MQTVPKRTVAMALLATVALAACPGGTVPTIDSFTATPPTTAAGGGPVTLAWNVTGAMTLSIDQGVGAVTPVTIGSKAVLVGATTTYTLTATDATGKSIATAQVTVALPPPTQTVNGMVVDIAGQPVSGETVFISAASFNQPAVTDTNGAFSIPDVPTPYNATVIDSAEAVQYQGLTRADPSLTAFFFLLDNRTAIISGTFSGGSFPEMAGYNTQFIFASPQTITSLGEPDSGSYTSTVRWPGPATTTGTLYALQVHSDALGLPLDYPGYGSLSGVTLQDTGNLGGQNVALSPVTAGLISGTVTAPAGYAVVFKSLSLEVTSGITLSLITDSDASATFSYVTPDIANTTLLVSAAAASAAGEFSVALKAGQSANGSGIVLNIPAAPTLTTPANLATGVTASTPFSWSTFPGGVYEFQASSTSGPPFTYFVITAATTTALADFGSAGVPVPASTQYSWSVIGLAPVSSIDLLTAAGGINKLTLDLTEGASVSETFTTGP
jgi:Carboxypeptidase regulatory-like domain